ncbi:MAG TPA: DUF6174 domain-containing protein [Roseiflexaceae bacterium]|nr:DUF6174 domain-containing protein [Roseiflexaceae bacterium]
MGRRDGVSAWRIFGLFVLGGLLIACAALAAVLLVPTSDTAHAAELAAARQRWQARPFLHYRMVLVDLRCRMEVDVEGTRVIRTTPQNCPQGSRSVDQLFQLIARDGQVGIMCAHSDCSCDDVYHIRAEYDEDLGFPSRIEVRLTPTPNWLHADFWQTSFKRRTMTICTQVEGSKQIVIESLTPLP